MREKNIQAFEDDIEHNAGYKYTTNAALSTRWAQERLSRAVREVVDLKGRSVIDVGCGDGTYTVELLAAEPAYVLGTDASQKVVDFAKGRIPAGATNIEFKAMEIYDLPAIGREFDVAIARSVLHHLYDAETGVKALMTLAKEVLVVEPNGYSPILKIFERTRKYHRQHEEKSYPPFRLDRWFERSGGVVVERHFVGLVPHFFPNWAARVLKAIEPWIERIPLIRSLSCAVYVVRIESR